MKCIETTHDSELVHEIDGHNVTRCGWARSWDGGSWPVVDDESEATTCLEYIGRRVNEEREFHASVQELRSALGLTKLMSP